MNSRKSTKMQHFHEDKRKFKKTLRAQGQRCNVTQLNDHYDDDKSKYNDAAENRSISDNDADFYEECRSMCANNDQPYFDSNGIDDFEPTLDEYQSDEDDDSTKGL